MDQIGTVAGLLIFTAFFLLLCWQNIGFSAYQKRYALLWIPFFCWLYFVHFLSKSS